MRLPRFQVANFVASRRRLDLERAADSSDKGVKPAVGNESVKTFKTPFSVVTKGEKGPLRWLSKKNLIQFKGLILK